MTSVSGFLNQAANVGFRLTSNDDVAIYNAIQGEIDKIGSSTPVYSIIGEQTGMWIKALLMVENESQEGASEYYTEVGQV